MPNLSTTLFDSFEIQGFWWLPTTPNLKIAGILRFANNDILLDLFGSLADNHVTEIGKVQPTFRAAIVVGQAHDGKQITLRGCTEISSKTTIPHGTVTTKISAECLAIGGHYSTDQALKFQFLEISFTHLEEWTCHRPFFAVEESNEKAEDGHPIIRRFEYHVPPPISFQIASLQSEITLDSQMFGKGLMSFHLDSKEHVALIRITPDNPQHIGWFLERIVDLQEFFTLLIDEPVFSKRTVLFGEEIDVGGTKCPNVVALFFHPAHGRLTERLSPIQILAPLPTVFADLGRLLNGWFDKREKLRDIADLFFGVTYNRYLFVRFQFLALIQGLETYSRGVHNAKYVSDNDYETIAAALTAAIPATTPSDLRMSLAQGKIKYGNEFSLRKRLRQILCELEDPTVKLICDSPGKFSNEVSATRNYLTHYTSELREEAFAGADLYAATLRLRVLTTILLLKEIGMNEQQIRKCFEGESRLARHVKSRFEVSM